MKSLNIFLLSFYVVYAKHELYDGYVVYEVSVKNVKEIQLVNELSHELSLDTWSHAIVEKPGDIFVSKEQRQPFEDALTAAGIQYELKVENIRELLELEDQSLASYADTTNSSRLVFGQIYTFNQVTAYLAEIARRYPNVVRLVNGGNSIEGRQIQYIEISTTNFQNTSKPVVVMHSLLHAREWVTLPVTLYAIHKLVVDVTESDMRDNIDWVIIPVVNPDGYTWTHTNERFWRKNRRAGSCMGVDLNRNFNSNFGKTGSRNNPCSNTFHGSGPNSEPETQVVVSVLNRYRSRIGLYTDFHGYGSMILYAWGNGSLPSNALTLNVAGVRMAQAIDKIKLPSMPNYRVGNMAQVLNRRGSGGASDFAQAIGIPFSYTHELPTYRGGGTNGFLVQNPQFIEQISFETWQGIVAGARYVLAIISVLNASDKL